MQERSLGLPASNDRSIDEPEASSSDESSNWQRRAVGELLRSKYCDYAVARLLGSIHENGEEKQSKVSGQRLPSSAPPETCYEEALTNDKSSGAC